MSEQIRTVLVVLLVFAAIAAGAWVVDFMQWDVKGFIRCFEVGC